MRIPRFLALLSIATLVLCAASFADTSFDFSTKGVGDLGSAVETFTGAGGGSITLWGFSATGVSTTGNVNLWFKNDGGDETGLGLKNDTVDHEIMGTSFIQFTALGITSVAIGSVQSGESFQLYGSNTLGTLGTAIGSLGTADGTVSLPPIDGGFKYVSVFSPAGNVLLDNATFIPAVPEPSTTAFILTLGLVGLFEVGRRKLRA
jgi:hypothetical protein